MAWLLLVAVWGCTGAPGDTSETADSPTVEDTDTDVDTGTDADTDTDVDTDTTAPSVDVANCPQPTLDEHYPGILPESPWATWPFAPDCLETRHDAIVILGCPSLPDGSSSSCQEDRVELALAFAQAGYGDQFIPTGGAVDNEHVEAHAMRDLLLEAGVDAAAIHAEPQAQHTDENIYYSTQIMLAQGWRSALVVSEPEHLMYAAVCDANCCVGLGRLITWGYPVGMGREKAASYLLAPPATPVSEGECTHLEIGSKAMCTNLDDRRACADDFQL